MIFNLFRINTAWLLVSIGILLIASERFTACLQLEELSPGECLTLSLRFNFPYWLRHAVHYSSTVQFVRDGTDEWLSESNAWHNSDMPCVDGGEKEIACRRIPIDWVDLRYITFHIIQYDSIRFMQPFSFMLPLLCVLFCSIEHYFYFAVLKECCLDLSGYFHEWRGWLTLRWNCEISRITFTGKVSLTVRSYDANPLAHRLVSVVSHLSISRFSPLWLRLCLWVWQSI